MTVSYYFDLIMGRFLEENPVDPQATHLITIAIPSWTESCNITLEIGLQNWKLVLKGFRKLEDNSYWPVTQEDKQVRNLSIPDEYWSEVIAYQTFLRFTDGFEPYDHPTIGRIHQHFKPNQSR